MHPGPAVPAPLPLLGFRHPPPSLEALPVGLPLSQLLPTFGPHPQALSSQDHRPTHPGHRQGLSENSLWTGRRSLMFRIPSPLLTGTRKLPSLADLRGRRRATPGRPQPKGSPVPRLHPGCVGAKGILTPEQGSRTFSGWAMVSIVHLLGPTGCIAAPHLHTESSHKECKPGSEAVSAKPVFVDPDISMQVVLRFYQLFHVFLHLWKV